MTDRDESERICICEGDWPKRIGGIRGRLLNRTERRRSKLPKGTAEMVLPPRTVHTPECDAEFYGGMWGVV